VTPPRPFTWPFPGSDLPVPPWDAVACGCDWELCAEPCAVAAATVTLSWMRDDTPVSAPETHTAEVTVPVPGHSPVPQP
jgi:hypothetical protein